MTLQENLPSSFKESSQNIPSDYPLPALQQPTASSFSSVLADSPQQRLENNGSSPNSSVLASNSSNSSKIHMNPGAAVLTLPKEENSPHPLPLPVDRLSRPSLISNPISLEFNCSALSETSNFSFVIDRNSSVADVKLKLSVEHPLQPHIRDQRLIYFGKFLDDSMVLRHLFKCSDDTAVMHLVLNGLSRSRLVKKPNPQPLSSVPREPRISQPLENGSTTSTVSKSKASIENISSSPEPSSSLDTNLLSALVHAHKPNPGQIIVIHDVLLRYDIDTTNGGIPFLERVPGIVLHAENYGSAPPPNPPEVQPRMPPARIRREAPALLMHASLLFQLAFFFFLFTVNASFWKTLLIGIICFMIFLARLGYLKSVMSLLKSPFRRRAEVDQGGFVLNSTRNASLFYKIQTRIRCSFRELILPFFLSLWPGALEEEDRQPNNPNIPPAADNLNPHR